MRNFFKFAFESHVSVWKKRAIICEIEKLIAITAVCFHYSSSYSRWIFGVFEQLVKFSQLINAIFSSLDPSELWRVTENEYLTSKAKTN